MLLSARANAEPIPTSRSLATSVARRIFTSFDPHHQLPERTSTMTFQDCLTTATDTVLDWDLPETLLPLVISNQASLLAGIALDSDDFRWH